MEADNPFLEGNLFFLKYNQIIKNKIEGPDIPKISVENAEYLEKKGPQAFTVRCTKHHY